MLESLLDPFARLLRDAPEAVLVASPRDHATVRDVEELAQALDAEIEASWLAPRQIVGIRAELGPAALAAVLACWRRRCVPFPLETGAPFLERMRTAEAAGVAAILDIAGGWPGQPHHIQVERIQPEKAYDVWDSRAAVHHAAWGEDGRANGIAIFAETLRARLDSLQQAIGLDSGETLFVGLPFGWGRGFTPGVVAPLLAVAPLVVPDPQGPWHPLDAAESLGASHALLTRKQLATWSNSAGRPLEQVRNAILVGCNSAPDEARRFAQRAGRPAQFLFAPATCGPVCFDKEGTAVERGGVGVPLQDVQIRLEDQLSPDQPARMIVESPAVATGFSPRPNPKLKAGIYRGDELARRVRGTLRIEGCRVERIDVDGDAEFVSPREIERAFREFEAVLDVHAMRVDGERGDRIQLVVAAAPGTRSEILQGWARRRLSPRKQPHHLVLVREIPRDSRGRADRDALSRLGPTSPSH